jgi:hypothetical protein
MKPPALYQLLGSDTDGWQILHEGVNILPEEFQYLPYQHIELICWLCNLHRTHEWSKIEHYVQGWLPCLPKPLDADVHARVEAVKAEWIQKYGNIDHFEYPNM